MLILIAFAIFIQISPGKLSKAHEKLEGLTNCLKCHSVGKKITNDKCLSCHTEIKETIKNSHGFHFSVKDKNCAQCHKEHFGRKFKLVNFNENKFNHTTTGFELKGKHAKIKCSKCHNPKFIIVKKLKSKSKTYLGLNSNCLSCHEDEHRGQFAQNCTSCHSFDNWKTAKDRFDHNRARFKLTGAHRKVDCYMCHKKKYDEKTKSTFVVFKNIKFSSCSNCHTDYHNGKFGKCVNCHSTSGWKLLKTKFDHNLTGYKLEGKHKMLKCEKCHSKVKIIKTRKDYNLNFKIKHEMCLDCHKDYHKGAFAKRKDKGDCKSCHSVNGFIPVTFTIERHNKETRFVLIASHSTLPCSDCHKTKKDEIFHWDELICETCHADKHGKQFADASGKTMCNDCHKPTEWKDLKFDHNKTRFKLIGKHADVNCEKCHNEKFSTAGSLFVKYRGTPVDCASCHKDIHMGQFANSNGFVDCAKCHTPHGWKNLKFNHNRDSRFKLTGAHKNLDCFRCHKTEISNGIEFVRFKPLPVNCEGCHG